MTHNRFFQSSGSFSLDFLCNLVGIAVPKGAEKSTLFSTTSSLEQAKPNTVSFFHNAKYLNDLKQTQAGVCLVAKEFAEHVPSHTVALISEKPYRDFAKICAAFYPRHNTYQGIFPTAYISPTATLGENCTLAPGVVIGQDVILGHNCFVGPNTVIEQACVIGDHAVIESNVTISHTVMGNNVFIKPGAKIGQPGFGFHMDALGHFDVPQLGCVIIGNNVHIGANTTIDRGSQTDTIIGNGVRIDNLVQIAHNVEIGDNSVLVAQVGVAGSTKLGRFVIAAGQVGIAGHLTVGDGVKIAAQSGLMRNVDQGETVAGSPAVSVRDWHRQTIALQKMAKGK
jgi:UDP-3-O-[3-hydroxymyristoyl] glucosamine N-acyltransferase